MRKMVNSNRLIIITGGTKGIGKAIVEKFAKAGWSIVTCARNKEELLTLKKAIKEKFDTSIDIFRANLSKKNEVKAFADFIGKMRIPVEILVNNTGRFIPGLVHEEPDGTLEEMIETNVYSAYYLSRAIVAGMKKEGRGHIFNLCSVASLMAYPNGGSYSISKFALYGMSKALREELKSNGIRVTSLMPGAVLTPSWDGVDLPASRFMATEDIADTIYNIYQLSERSVVEEIVLRPQLGDI